MWSGQGCKVTPGSFSQVPASCWVRPITPWSISLNMPSPPTHTTLFKSSTRPFVYESASSDVFFLIQSASSTYPSNPIRSFFRRWSLAWFARSVTNNTRKTQKSWFLTMQFVVLPFFYQEFVWEYFSVTYYMRADTSQLKQRSHEGLKDLPCHLLSSKRVDEHQESMWT